MIGKAIDKMDALLGASGACLVYAGYPYDPFATNTLKLGRSSPRELRPISFKTPGTGA